MAAPQYGRLFTAKSAIRLTREDRYLDRVKIRDKLSEAARQRLDQKLIQSVARGTQHETRFLLLAGAYENARDANGDTTLLICGKLGHTDTTRELLLHFADLGLDNNGQYPFDAAIEAGHMNTADVMGRALPILTDKMRQAAREASEHALQRGFSRVYTWAQKCGLT